MTKCFTCRNSGKCSYQNTIRTVLAGITVDVTSCINYNPLKEKNCDSCRWVNAKKYVSPCITCCNFSEWERA